MCCITFTRSIKGAKADYAYRKFSTLGRFMKVPFSLTLPFAILCLFSACKQPAKPVDPSRPSFESVKGLRFTEVSRKFNTGLIFDRHGYQLDTPSWKMYFLADDSVLIFNAKKGRYIDFHVYFDHDSIFNMANTWFKVKKLSKDSLVMQVLKVENEKNISTTMSNVYMVLYGYNYYKKVPAKVLNRLKSATFRDTLFIQQRSKLANANIDSAFAARQPVELKSKSSQVTVSRRQMEQPNKINGIDPAEEYLYPEYDITINKAYDNFSYPFSVLVDDKGQLHFDKPLIDVEPEYKEALPKTLKAITDGYLKLYLDAKPGTTLGVPHTSMIIVHVIGNK
jgi:hypothetical protein